MNNLRQLRNRHILVSGGSKGIGLACARELSRHCETLSMLARDIKTLHSAAQGIKDNGSRAVLVEQCDVTNIEEVTTVIQKLSQRAGPVDVLVNNVGHAQSAPFLKTSWDTWNQSIEINLKSTVVLTHAVLAAMLKAQYGRIINIASTAGLKGYPYVTAYSAAKHAVIGLTRSLALEVAQYGITVNAVCPGFTDTPMLRDSICRVAQLTKQSEEQVKSEFLKSSPLGRFIEPHEVASAVAWLADPQQAAITGQVISINGGECA